MARFEAASHCGWRSALLFYVDPTSVQRLCTEIARLVTTPPLPGKAENLGELTKKSLCDGSCRDCDASCHAFVVKARPRRPRRLRGRQTFSKRGGPLGGFLRITRGKRFGNETRVAVYEV